MLMDQMQRQAISTEQDTSEAVRWPHALLAEFGTIIPPEVQVRVHDSNANMRYLILPMRPDGTDGWTEDQLAGIVTRDCMIDVALPSATGAPA